MARKATGQVLPTPGKRGTAYAIRFHAYGERRYLTLGNSADGWTHAKAEEELGNVLADVRRGTWQPPSSAPSVAPADDPVFHEFASEWFEAIRPELAEKTAEAYRWHLTHFLLPFFKDYRLSEITVQTVDQYRQAKVAERNRIARARERGDTKRKPASNETINKTIVRLGQILDLAVEYGHIPGNPARGKRRKLKAAKPQRSYLDTSAQITALLEAASELEQEAKRYDVPRRAMLTTLLFGGLRLGEFLSLRWQDVDLTDGWLTIEHAKTDAGTRRVKIRPVLRETLISYKVRSSYSKPTDLVFPTTEGKGQSASNFRRRVLAKVVERADTRLVESEGTPLPTITPHSLRRTFASLLYAIGEPPTVVMQEMGHSNPNLALRIYAQAMRRDEAENDRLRALIEGSQSAEKGRNSKVADLKRRRRNVA